MSTYIVDPARYHYHNHNYNNRDRNSSMMINTKQRIRIENVTEGLPSNCFCHLYNRIFAATAAGPRGRGSGKENGLTICDYMSSMKSEINPSNHYRKDTIILLSNLSTFFGNAKSFKEITREDILSFLDSFRKAEDIDPLHKWIGTYNIYRIQLMRFFKWLYFPDVEQKKRPKPSIIEN
ncbi:MAG: hypothetical protein ACJ719_04300, partial [Nitrososphaeraceae archaeon]